MRIAELDDDPARLNPLASPFAPDPSCLAFNLPGQGRCCIHAMPSKTRAVQSNSHPRAHDAPSQHGRPWVVQKPAGISLQLTRNVWCLSVGLFWARHTFIGLGIIMLTFVIDDAL